MMQSVRLDNLGLAGLKLSWRQMLRKHLDLAGYTHTHTHTYTNTHTRTHIYGAENKMKEFRQKNIFLVVHLKLLGPWTW